MVYPAEPLLPVLALVFLAPHIELIKQRGPEFLDSSDQAEFNHPSRTDRSDTAQKSPSVYQHPCFQGSRGRCHHG